VNLSTNVSARKFELELQHKEARVEFALLYIAQDQNFWRKVVFSDEKTFQFLKEGQIRVYRLRNSKASYNSVTGKNPVWTSYEKLRTVIEKKMFSNTEELLPVISFNAKASADEAKKHEDFVNRMVDKGYTPKQVRLLCEWYLRVRKSS
jgi:predicted Ser/Thr protein kinase